MRVRQRHRQLIRTEIIETDYVQSGLHACTDIFSKFDLEIIDKSPSNRKFHGKLVSVDHPLSHHILSRVKICSIFEMNLKIEEKKPK